jgi:hypothetical protein
LDIEVSILVARDGDRHVLERETLDLQILMQKSTQLDPKRGLRGGGYVRPVVGDSHVLERHMQDREETQAHRATDVNVHSQGIGGGHFQS